MRAVRRSSSIAPRTGVPGGGSGVALLRHEPQVVTAAGPDDAGLDAAPEQHAVVGGLSAAAGVEGGAVQDDALRIDVENHRVPLAQRGVSEVESLGAALVISTHDRDPSAEHRP